MTSGADPREVELLRVRIPLHRPHRAAHGTESVRDLVLVHLRRADGVEGWGECSALSRPTYTAEHTAGAWAVLREELVPALLAGRPSGVVGHPMAAHAIATAVADADGVATGRSLAATLAAARPGAGPGPATSVATAAVVGLGDAEGTDGSEAMLAAVASHLESGVVLVKLKVTPASHDLAAVAAVRAAWPDLDLAVDFNGTADAEALRRLAPLGLRYVEQPAPADDLVASARAASLVGSPVALDESATGIGAIEAAHALGAVGVVNVKPARCGSPAAAVRLAERARELGLGVFVGGMLESGVGRATALAVAAQAACTLPTDLGPSDAYVEVDVTDPIVRDGTGRLVVPDGPGIGRRPDPARLDPWVVERATFAP